MTQRRAEFNIVNRPPIPACWEKLVMTCLAKTPEARPQNGAAVLALLSAPVVMAIKPKEVIQAAAVKAVAPLAEEAVAPVVIPKIKPAKPILSKMSFKRQGQSSRRLPLLQWTRTFLRIAAVSALTAGGLHLARPYLANRKPEPTAEPKSVAPTASLLEPKEGGLRRSSLPLGGAVLDRINEAGKKLK